MADTVHRLMGREDLEATRRPLMRREDIAPPLRPFEQASPLAGPPYHDAAILEAEFDRIFIRCEWLFTAEAVARDDFDPSDAVDFWHLTNQQDWAICERAQKGVRSRGYEPGRYQGLEETIYFFDNWYLRAMERALSGDAEPAGDSGDATLAVARLAEAGGGGDGTGKAGVNKDAVSENGGA